MVDGFTAEVYETEDGLVGAVEVQCHKCGWTNWCGGERDDAVLMSVQIAREHRRHCPLSDGDPPARSSSVERPRHVDLERLEEAARQGWTDLELMACGCVFGKEVREDGDEAFGISPCSLDCRYWRLAMDESARQGNRLEIRMERSEQ